MRRDQIGERAEYFGGDAAKKPRPFRGFGLDCPRQSKSSPGDWTTRNWVGVSPPAASQ